ncbi:unnamed protein product [Ectocarpus sp. 13 AM-2016]
MTKANSGFFHSSQKCVRSNKHRPPFGGTCSINLGRLPSSSATRRVHFWWCDWKVALFISVYLLVAGRWYSLCICCVSRLEKPFCRCRLPRHCHLTAALFFSPRA